jgi:hypothetical protein
VTPYSFVEVYWCFRGTFCSCLQGRRYAQHATSFGGSYYLHLQDRKTAKQRKQKQAGSVLSARCLFRISSILKMEQITMLYLACYMRFIYSTLKMEAVRSSETSGKFYWPTWRQIPEDSTVQYIIYFHSLSFFHFLPPLYSLVYVS